MSLATTAWSFGKANRPDITGGNRGGRPGPGQYGVAGKSLVNDSKPAFSVGKSQRSGLSKPGVNIPGPGMYKTLDEKKSNSVSIAKKLGSCLDAGKRRAPGPGMYDPNPVRAAVPGGKMGVKLSKGGGLEVKKTNPNLGPGSYYHPTDIDKLKNSKNEKSKSTFGSSRQAIKSNMNNPGPGMYSTDQNLLK